MTAALIQDEHTARLSGSRFQCADCFRHFAGPHAFARHRTTEYAPGQRTCLTPSEMARDGLTLNHAGFWAINRTALSTNTATNPTPQENSA